MQTTLLGLAIALILALVSALVAPLVVDWNHYRSQVEAEAGRLTGLNVRVGGTIEARLLPSPVITLHDVEVGGAGQKPLLRSGTIKLELALGPLMRGHLQASNVDLVEPQLSLGLDRSGAVDWPQPSALLRPDGLSVSRLNVEGGRIAFTDAASGTHLVLQKVWFTGDFSSFTGSFSGDGAVVAGDELFGYRVSGSHGGDVPGIQIKFGVYPSNHPLTADFDGRFTFAGGVPQFDGAMVLARPVGATLANGRRVVSAPWRAAATIRATPVAAAFDHVAFRYGPEERALNFTGSAKLTLGAHPRLDGSIAALQADLDQALATPDLTNRPPFLVLRGFLQGFVAAAKLPIPAQIGIGIDALTVGGTAIEAVHGNLQFDAAGWTLDKFSFHAPGMTDVSVNGRLTGTPEVFEFKGPATLHSADVDMLMGWLTGRNGGRPSVAAKTISAQGNVTIASNRMAVDGLSAMLDREKIEGQLAYDSPAADHPARLVADLSAAALDVDTLTAFAKATLGEGGFAPPQQATLKLDIGKATYAGVVAQKVNAQITFDSGKLHIDRFSIDDLGGAALAISGRIDELSSQPQGQLTFNLDARALQGLTGIAAKIFPQGASFLRRVADHAAPAKIQAVLNVEHKATSGSVAELHLNGNLAAMRISVDGNATGEPAKPGAATFQLGGRIDADDGSALVALLGLNRVLAVDQLPGRLTASASGSLNGAVKVDGKIVASGFESAIGGVLHLAGGKDLSGGKGLAGGKASAATLQVTASARDLRPLQQAMTGQPGSAAPVSASAALAVKGATLSFTNLAAKVGNSSLKGHVDVEMADPVGIDGEIEADKVDVSSIAGMLLGLPGNAATTGVWSSEPLGAGAFGGMKGALAFRVGHAVLTPSLEASDLDATAEFRQSQITLDDIEGTLAGGRVTGTLAFRRDPDGLGARASIELTGADAKAVLGSALGVDRGTLTMSIACDGFGASPLGLIGSLHGSDAVTLKDVRFAGLDAAAFDAAIRAAGQGGAIDLAKVEPAVSAALTLGHLVVPQGNVAVTVSAGAASLRRGTLQAQGGAELSINGIVDLGNQTIDGRMTLAEPPPAAALIRARPEFSVAVKGPLTAPQRTLDIAALTSWLTLNAAELQTRHIEAIEADGHVDAAGSNVHQPSPDLHLMPRGPVVETAIPPNLIAPLSAGALERLPQQPAPPVAPGQALPNSGSAGRGSTAAEPTPVPVPRPSKPNEPHAQQSPRTPPESSVLNFLFGRHD